MKRIVTIFTIACVLLSMSMLLPVSAATVDFSVNFDDEPDGATADETLLGRNSLCLPVRRRAAQRWSQMKTAEVCLP